MPQMEKMEAIETKRLLARAKGLCGLACVRWRDESVALPDTLEWQRKTPAANKVESHLRFPGEEMMPKKPTVDDARVILELYDVRREPEVRKARQWWRVMFWPKNPGDVLKVATAMRARARN